MALTDGELVAKVLAGDSEAFAVLFHKYARTVHAVALARTTRRPAAAELTRRAFEQVYADLESLPDGVRFSQFLLSKTADIATGYVRDHGRSLQMLRVGSREARRSGTALDFRTVMKDLPSEEGALVCLEVLARLPPTYEVPFLLRHLEGMGYADIAEVTGQTLAEVRTALDSGRRLFEREFKHALELAG